MSNVKSAIIIIFNTEITGILIILRILRDPSLGQTCLNLSFGIIP